MFISGRVGSEVGKVMESQSPQLHLEFVPAIADILEARLN